MTEVRIVLTTAESVDEGRKLARLLVECRLAACVNIVPQIESVYRWQGAVEVAGECLLVIKTTAGCFPELKKTILENHSYEVPECMCLPVEDGSEKYLKWVSESVEPSKRT